MTEPVDLLERPIYSLGQVDWLLALSPGTARRWIDGYERAGKHYQPVIRIESTGEETVTWGEFVETRLLSEYRDAGVPMLRLRPAVDRLRDELGLAYPLAYAKPFVWGKELVLRIQDEVSIPKKLALVVARNNQVVLTDPADNFLRSVEYEGEDGAIQRMHPLPELRHVVIDPLRRFGDPVVRSVPTEVIAEQVRAGDSIEMIGELYELSRDQVEAAIRYELIRGRPATEPAA